MREAGPARLRREQQRRQRLQAGKQSRQAGIVEVMQEQLAVTTSNRSAPAVAIHSNMSAVTVSHVPAEFAEIIAQPVRDEVEAIQQHQLDRGPVSTPLGAPPPA